jgi:hypothetical protein
MSALKLIYEGFRVATDFNLITTYSYSDTLLIDFKQYCIKMIRFNVGMINPLLVINKT